MSRIKIDKNSNEPPLEEILFAFRRKLAETLKKEALGINCPLSHIDTIIFVAEKNNPTMTDIAKHLKITPPSTTAIIETLQKKNIVKRVTNPNDRRTIRVELTSKALILLKKLHEKKFEIFKKMLSKLSAEDQKEFIRIMGILIKD